MPLRLGRAGGMVGERRLLAVQRRANVSQALNDTKGKRRVSPDGDGVCAKEDGDMVGRCRI
jgi:hypothetical protein